MPPLVSIIIPCYNDGKYLREAVASAQAQTYAACEIIIINDHSSDPHTIEVLRELTAEGVTVITTPDGKKGLSAARNTGIAHAKGAYILPLDADDKIAPTYMAKALALLESDPDVVICGCKVRFFGLKHHRFQQPALTLSALVLEEYKLVCTCLYRKNDWTRVGGYDESLVLGKEDMIFWLDLLAQGGKVAILPEELFFYRVRPRSMTAQVTGAPSEHDKLTALYAARPEIFQSHILDFMDALARYREEKAQTRCLFSWKIISPLFALEWSLRQHVKRLLGRA